MAMDFYQEEGNKNIVNDSFEFFVDLVRTSPKRTKAEKTSLKVILA